MKPVNDWMSHLSIMSFGFILGVNFILAISNDSETANRTYKKIFKQIDNISYKEKHEYEELNQGLHKNIEKWATILIDTKKLCEETVDKTNKECEEELKDAKEQDKIAHEKVKMIGIMLERAKERANNER